jgi:hypothetical protein
MVQAGEQGGLLAEVSRQRHDLDIERHGGQRSGDIAGTIAAAVVDIDDFQVQSALDLQVSRDFGNAFMQIGQARGLVEQGNDNGQHRCRG